MATSLVQLFGWRCTFIEVLRLPFQSASHCLISQLLFWLTDCIHEGKIKEEQSMSKESKEVPIGSNSTVKSFRGTEWCYWSVPFVQDQWAESHKPVSFVHWLPLGPCSKNQTCYAVSPDVSWCFSRPVEIKTGSYMKKHWNRTSASTHSCLFTFHL